jgi:Rieske 2Fe-2S family protein
MIYSRHSIEHSRLDALIANHQPGYSLDQAFYMAPEIFEEEFKHLFSRQWQFTDHISRIPKKGDFFVFKIAGEEIIVVRGEGEAVHAHFNVCRHRGSRVCLASEGHAKRLTCPYHAWSYGLDGRLANARAMGESVDKTKLSLRSCQVRVFEGLIFINLTAEGEGTLPNFTALTDPLRPWVEQADLRHTKIAHVESFRSPVNWKVAFENYFECYHCVASHPEWCKVQLHTLRDAVGTDAAVDTFAKRNKLWEAKAKELGQKTGLLGDGNIPIPDPESCYNAQYAYAERMTVNDNSERLYSSLTPNGADMPSKLLGTYRADDEGQADWGLAPSCFLYTTCTYSTVLRVTPLGPLDTDQQLMWLVHEDAKEGIDYDIESMKWLASTTMTQDRQIVEDTQAGVASRSYVPGPYAELEYQIPQLQSIYLRALQYGRSLG